MKTNWKNMTPGEMFEKKLRMEIAYLYLKIHGKNVEANSVLKTNIQTIHEYNKMMKSANASELIKELLVKTDQLLDLYKPGSRNYDEVVLMKSGALRVKVIFDIKMTERIKSLQEAITWAAPYSETKKGFWIYIQCLIQLELCLRNTFQFGKAMDCLKEADKLYKSFTEKTPNISDIWTLDNLLVGKFNYSKMTPENYKFTFYQIASGFWTHYEIAKNEQGQLEYAIPYLHYLEKTQKLEARKFTNFQLMVTVIELLLKKRMFKMVDQCLAGLYFMLMEYRRGVPKTERKNVNSMLSNAALLFVGWGYHIVYMSIRRLRKLHTGVINNEFYEEIPMFQANGAQQYARQLPIDFVDTYEELELVLQCAKNWLLKSNELSDEIVPGQERTVMAYMLITLGFEIEFYKNE